MGRTKVLAACFAALALAACGQTVPGAPVADDTASRETTDQLFEAAEKALAEATNAGSSVHPARVAAYSHVRFAGVHQATEYDVSLRGHNPEILLRRSSQLDPSIWVEIYHPAMSPVDYLQLGPKFTHLAPTPWVSYPTYYAPEGLVSCSLPAIMILCEVSAARVATERAKPPTLTRQSKKLADGSVELRSGASVRALIDNALVRLNTELSKRLTAEAHNTVLPVKIVLHPDRKLQSIEVVGEVAATGTTLRVQIGFENRGRGDRQDFPAGPPAPAQTTALPTEAARAELWDKIFNAV